MSDKRVSLRTLLRQRGRIEARRLLNLPVAWRRRHAPPQWSRRGFNWKTMRFER